MPLLLDAERAAAWAEWMRVNRDAVGACTKQEVRLAVNAIDQWLEDNQAALNAAIPQPARTGLSTKQKAHILCMIIERRYGL